MNGPNPQTIVNILRSARDERADEIGDWLEEGDKEMTAALQEEVEALNHLLEKNPQGKPRIVRLLELLEQHQ